MTLLLSALLSEFHIERRNVKEAYAFRYREGKNDYYLCVESAGKVLLRVSSMNIDVNNLLLLTLLMLYKVSKVIDRLKG